MERDSSNNSTYAVSIESGNDLGVRPDFLIRSFNSIYGNAVKSAPRDISNELVIVQDRSVNTTFHIRVSNKMAPYLIKAIQDENQPTYGVALKSYFHRLQEQIMSQIFSNVKDLTFPRFS